VKFPTGQSQTAQAEGAVEYVYSLMARNAGITFGPTRLIETGQGPGYFACQRFDRAEQNQRIHMHTFAGLVNADFSVPDADYEILMKATSHVIRSHLDLCEVLRRMIFNILSGNRDDHTKNFSYLMSADGTWQLSPAYDLTFNTGINDHHSMSIMGHGKNIPRAAIPVFSG
jgi:serine/threonine-protein kinase HipA